MRGKCDLKNIWPIGWPQENFDNNLCLNTRAILKVYAYHKFIKNETVSQSCRSVALKISQYASPNEIPKSGLGNLTSKVRSLRDKWMKLRDHLTRKSKREVSKRNSYVDRELFKEFNFGKMKEKKKSFKSTVPTPYSDTCSEIPYLKRSKTSKLVGFLIH